MHQISATALSSFVQKAVYFKLFIYYYYFIYLFIY